MYLRNDFDKKELEYKYTGTELITRKTKENEKIGKVDIYYEGHKLTSVDIILKDKPRFSITKYLLAHKVIVIAILLIVLFFILKNKKHKKRKVKKKKRVK